MGTEFIRAVQNDFIDETQQMAWPGVIVMPGARPARVFRFSFTEAFIDALLSKCDDLFALEEKALPSNLHCLDARGKVLLGSITGEKDAWTEMSSLEWESHVSRWPELGALSAREP